MKTRIVAIVGAAAVALGLTAATLLGLGYSAAIATEPNDSSEFTPPPRPPETVGSTSSPLPTVDDIPEGLSDDEHAHYVQWLTWSQLTDACMDDAGFAEWYYTAPWEDTSASWVDAFNDHDRLVAAASALGGNPGSGADYRWQDAGCQGAATETLGISS